jgi:purine-nucleoside phosphorylase
MGMPSIGIYAYELFKFYDVDKIIRIGTCGSNREDIKILDVLLAESSYTLSTFAELFDNFKEKEISASKELNDKIKETANSMNINIKTGKIITSDVFNPYVDSNEEYFSHYPSDINSIGSEMESFALFFLAHKLNKQAACLLTVVDSPYEDIVVSSFDRQNSLDSMIEVALNSI